MEEIRNKVSESGLITIDLEVFFPKEEEIVPFDLKGLLFMEMVLKEKDFREGLENLDLTPFRNKTVAVFCSTDAIIPLWAYMLVATKLYGNADGVYQGTQAEVMKTIFTGNIRQFPAENMQDKRVVLKGCGDREIPAYAYLEMTNRLLPYVRSLMYGEPCSTVPVFKRKS